MNERSTPAPDRTQAGVRRSRWPGWIWAIPLAALLLIGWWLLRTLTRGGEDITISFTDVHGMKNDNTNVVYRGMKVGKVSKIELAKDGGSVEVKVHVEESVKPFLTSGTQFWLRGAQPSLSDLSSLASVVSGPTIVMAPGPGPKETHFVGRAERPVVTGARSAPAIYGVALNGEAGRLKHGAPVKLRGFTIGEVRDVGFHYDARSGAITTPVTLALYPKLLHPGAAKPPQPDEVAGMIEGMIQHGLEAKLDRDPPVIGDPEVVLEIPANAKGAAPPAVDGVPQIPAEAGGGIQSLVARIGKLPIDEIAQNVLDATRHADAIAASPGLKDAVSELDATLKQIHEAAAAAAPKIGPLADELRRTAGRIDAAASSAQQLMSGTTSQSNTQQAMREITEAARSVRDLATYLDRHPEAIVKGRTGE